MSDISLTVVEIEEIAVDGEAHTCTILGLTDDGQRAEVAFPLSSLPNLSRAIGAAMDQFPTGDDAVH